MNTIQQFMDTDGPFLQKLPKFETSTGPSADVTRHTYTLTTGTGQLDTERKALIKAMYTAMENCFDDTTVVKVTAIACIKCGQLMKITGIHLEMTGLPLYYSSLVLTLMILIRVEWPMLKNAVLEAFLSSAGSTSWSQVNRRFGEEYPCVEFL